MIRSGSIAIALALFVFMGFQNLSSANAAGDPTVFITGSSRGIGLELTRQYAEKGWNVIATCRSPETATDLNSIASDHPNVQIVQLDVLDFDRIDALAEQYKETPIDVLINNAGISGGGENQNFGEIDFDAFDDVMNVNVKAPIKIAEAFLDLVAASELKKIITISSTEGSIGMISGPPRGYIYRPSKTAVNMAMRNLAIAVASRKVIVGIINPGAVDTDFMKGVPMALMPPQESVSQVIQVIDNYTLDSSGTFIDYNGEQLPW